MTALYTDQPGCRSGFAAITLRPKAKQLLEHQRLHSTSWWNSQWKSWISEVFGLIGCLSQQCTMQ